MARLLNVGSVDGEVMTPEQCVEVSMCRALDCVRNRRSTVDENDVHWQAYLHKLRHVKTWGRKHDVG